VTFSIVACVYAAALWWHLPGGRGVGALTVAWLEGRPIAELDTGVIVTLDVDGEPVVMHDHEDGFG